MGTAARGLGEARIRARGPKSHGFTPKRSAESAPPPPTPPRKKTTRNEFTPKLSEAPKLRVFAPKAARVRPRSQPDHVGVAVGQMANPALGGARGGAGGGGEAQPTQPQPRNRQRRELKGERCGAQAQRGGGGQLHLQGKAGVMGGDTGGALGVTVGSHTVGSHWGHAPPEVTLGSYWGHTGVIHTSRDHIGVIWGSQTPFRVILGSHTLSGVILGSHTPQGS